MLMSNGRAPPRSKRVAFTEWFTLTALNAPHGLRCPPAFVFCPSSTYRIRFPSFRQQDSMMSYICASSCSGYSVITVSAGVKPGAMSDHGTYVASNFFDAAFHRHCSQS